MGGQSNELKGPDLAGGVPFAGLTDGQPLLGHAGGEAVVLVRRGDDCFAVGATCSHYSGPLAEGLVVDGTIRCPWHHARFDLSNGAPLGGPGINPLPCYEVAREGALVRITGKREAQIRRAGPASRVAPANVVIVGSGPAGAVVADTLRAQGYEGPVTIVGEEGIPLDRPNLSKDYLAGTAPEEWLPLRDEAAFKQKNISLVSARVDAIDLAQRSLRVNGRGDMPFDTLVVATGAAPVRLRIPGADRPEVHVLRTLADSRAIIAAAEGARQVVVIGGGFIGLEVAASLRTRNLEVTVVLREQVALEKVLGPALGSFVEELHVERGVKFVRDVTAEIEAGAVILQSGKRLPADLVVMGVGVRPRVELAEAAGLKVDDGIVVDDRLRTSAKNVFAVGDVARFPWGPAGSLLRIEHFVHAERMGFVAAQNVLGGDQRFRFAPFFWSQHYDVPIAYVGGGPWDAVQMLGDARKRDVLAIFRHAGRPVALASIYRDQESLTFEHLLEQADVAALDAFVARLLSS